MSKIDIAIDILDKMQRGIRSNLPPDPNIWKDYEPSPTQKTFHINPAKERILLGANKSGKSYAGAAETAFFLTGIYPPWYPKELQYHPEKTKDRPFKAIVNVETMLKVKDNIVPYLNRFLHNKLNIWWNMANPQKHITEGICENGARVVFISNRMRTEAIEGGFADFFWADEPPKLDHYIAILRALLKKENRIIMTMTPLRFTWISRFFYDPPPVLKEVREKLGQWAVPFVVEMPLSENKYYTEEEKTYWATSLRAVSEDEAKARLLGIPYDKMGSIFPEFDENKHIITAEKLNPKEWTIVHSLDPHDKKGNCHLWLAIKKPNEKGISRKIILHCAFDPVRGKTIEEDVQMAKDIEENYIQSFFTAPVKVAVRYIDPRYAEQRQTLTGLSYHETYSAVASQKGYPMTFIAGSGSMSIGHSTIRQALKNIMEDGNPELMVDTANSKMIESFRHYCWQYGKDSPEDNEHKDVMDALRYAICQATYLDTNKENETVNELIDALELDFFSDLD